MAICGDFYVFISLLKPAHLKACFQQVSVAILWTSETVCFDHGFTKISTEWGDCGEAEQGWEERRKWGRERARVNMEISKMELMFRLWFGREGSVGSTGSLEVPWSLHHEERECTF